MTELVFTYVPFEFKKPKTWVSAIVRNLPGKKKKGSSSHSCYFTDKYFDSEAHEWVETPGELWVVESDIGGVKCKPYTDWISKRIGNWLDCYEVPEDHMNWDLYAVADGKPYDYWDAVSHFFNNDKAFEKKKFKRFTCSKLTSMIHHQYDSVAIKRGLPPWYKALPKHHQLVAEHLDYKLDKRIIEWP